MIRLNAATQKSYVVCFCLTLLLLPVSLYAECQIGLSWLPNDSTPGGYRLFQRESGETYSDNIYTDVGLDTNCTVSGLIDNTTYHFVVRAYVGAEESGNSNEATYNCVGDTTGDSNPPFQPAALTPSDKAQDVSLEPTLTTSAFIDPDAGDYHAETQWAIYRFGDDVCVFETTSTSDLTSLTVPPSTLAPLTTYYWSACYYDKDGNRSTPSQTCDFTTLQTAADEQSASLSSGSGSGSSGGGSGIGCFIQTLLGIR